VRTLATNVPVTAGWWTWDIPSGETPGVNYRIRLRTLEAPVAIDYSDGTYEIGLIQDVTLLVESSLSHVQYNRRTGESFGIVTVANISGGDFLIPITAVIEDISTPNVTVKNHDGTTDTGDPYFDLSDLATGGVLMDEEEVSFEIVFNNTTRERFIFGIGVYALVPSP
jgi:hypothetical protein